MRTAPMLTIGSATLAAMLLAGCTPAPTQGPTVTPTQTAAATPSRTPTPTPSPTPTPTLSADQKAALSQTRGFLSADERLSARPASEFSQKLITEALQPYATGPIITSMLDGYRDRAEKGIHVVGETLEVWAEVAEPTHPDNTTSIEVTICRDQRETRALDAKGRVVDQDHPDFVRLSFEMQDVDGAFKVWQVRSGGESCDR